MRNAGNEIMKINRGHVHLGHVLFEISERALEARDFTGSGAATKSPFHLTEFGKLNIIEKYERKGIKIDSLRDEVLMCR